MAAADTARLIAQLTLDDKNFTANVNKAMGSLGKLGVKTTAVGTALGVGFERLAEKGAGLLVDAVKGGIDSLEQLESATTSADAAISQMGLSGQITAKQIADWSQQIEDSVGAAFDDKAILAASTTLLRFGKVTPANLKQALVVMTDLATKTGDIDSAASLLAKALADPTKAAGKLARSGVVLTKAEQDQIKAMVKAGDTAKAQAFLLDKLEASTKGAAAASQGPAARAAATLRDAFEDAQRALAEGLLPVIDDARGKLTTFLKDPQTITRIRDFGKAIAGGFEKLIELGSKIPWGTIGQGLKTAADWAGKLIDVFANLPPEVQTTIVALAGLNKLSGGAVGSIVGELGKGLIKGVLGMTAGVVNINAATVNGVGGGAGALGEVAGGAGVAAFATVALTAGTIAALGALFIRSQQEHPRNDPGFHEGQVITPGRGFGPTSGHGQRDDIGAVKTAIETGNKLTRDDLAEVRAAKLVAQRQAAATEALSGVTAQTARYAADTAAAVRNLDFPTPIVNVNVNTSVSLTALERGTVTRRRASYDTSIVAS